jgi:hypothetical protein
MISVREAVQSATAFARGVLDDTRSGNLRLEEVEIRENPSRWLVTLSMPAINSFGNPSQQREYKAFLIDGENGEVLWMKIRELAGAA